MNLDELRALIAVVETGSMVAAARQLRYPRATLRRRLDELEARTGIPLIVRSTQGVEATPAGELLVRSGRVLLQQAGALMAHVREMGTEPSGIMRVLLAHGLPVEVTAMIVNQAREYRRLNLELRYSTNPLAESLDDVDIVLHFGEQIPDGPWLSYRLIELRERLMATESYLAERGTPTSLSDLADHDIFAWTSPDHPTDRLPVRDHSEFTFVPRVQSSDVYSLRLLAAMGQGIAFVPDNGMALPGDPTGHLIPVLDDLVGRPSSLRLLVPAPLIELPKVRVAMDLLRTFMGSVTPEPTRG